MTNWTGRLCVAASLVAVAFPVPALAAGSDYLLKLGGVDGESTKAEAGHQKWTELTSVRAADGEAASGGDDGRHKEWIEILSLRFARIGEAAAAGGVNVAAGDVDGDGRADVADAGAHQHHHQPIVMRKRIDKSAPAAPAGPDAVSSGGDQTAALLLPAVQKVREAALRLPAWKGCTVGQKLADVQLMEKSTGRTGRIEDATVTECAAEQVSLNFTKIKW